MKSIRADLDLCLKWQDYRLQPVDINSDMNVSRWTVNRFGGHYDKIKLTEVDRLWSPGVYFRNSKSTQITQALLPLQYMEIWPDSKTIHMCIRFRVYTECLLELSNFPFDSNHCYFELENCKCILVEEFF